MTRSKRKTKGEKRDADDWAKALEEKMRAWKEMDRELLTSLDEVGGVELEAWLCDAYVVKFPHTLSPAQRRLIHMVSGNLGLAHASFGSESKRYVMTSRDPDFLANVDVDGSYNESGDSPTAKSPSARAVPSHKWFDPSITIKPVVAPHFLRAGLQPQHQQQQQLLLQSMTSYFGIHAELCVRISRASRRRAFDGSSSSGNAGQGQGSPPLEASYEAAPSTLRHTRPWSPSLVKVVDTVPQLLAMTATLSRCHEIAFDVEMHSYRSYHGMTCLLQLASTQGDIYLVDTLAVWDSVGPTLRPLFANPKIVKIGHAVSGGDVPALHRDFGIVIVNCFCTQVATTAAGLAPAGRDGHPGSPLGLARMLTVLECPDCESFTSAKGDMKFCDWRRRPLTPNMLMYASKDVHYLVDCYFILAHMLVEQSSEVLAGAEAGDEVGEGTVVVRAWGGLGAGVGAGAGARPGSTAEDDDDDDESMLFVDTSLPPPQAGLGGDDFRGNDDEDVVWDGWGDVDSPAPLVSPSHSQAGPTHQTRRTSSPALPFLPMSPVSAATEEEDCSEDATVENDARAHMRLYQTAIEGSFLPPDDAVGAKAPVAPSALPLVTMTASQVVNDSAYDGLYRVLLDGAKSASQRLWVAKPYSLDAWRRETGYSHKTRHLQAPQTTAAASSHVAEVAEGSGGWTEGTVHVYRYLHRWRNDFAQVSDESPHYIASGSDLFLLAEHRPQTTAELVALFAARHAPLPSSLARDVRVERATLRLEAANSKAGEGGEGGEVGWEEGGEGGEGGEEGEGGDVEHVRAVKAAQRDWTAELMRREAIAEAVAAVAVAAAAAEADAGAEAATGAGAGGGAGVLKSAGPVFAGSGSPLTPARTPAHSHSVSMTPSPLASRSPLSPRGLQQERAASTGPGPFPLPHLEGAPPSPDTKLVWTAAFAGTIVGAWLTVGCQLAIKFMRESR